MEISFSQIAINLISTSGYYGMALGLLLDSFGVPIPSEILVPLSTVLVMQGRFQWWAVFLIATGAQVAGALVAYLVGRYGGEPLLERYGKYVLISRHDLERTHRLFERYGGWLTMLGRCVPGVRGLVGYPAGIAEMDLRKFLLYSAAGSAVWTAFLMYLGYLLGDNLALMDQLASRFSVLGIILVVGLLAWHFRHHWWRRGRS
ncbi:MAG TPA: DedA family protein [Candidatus Saccharimonas sp.]|nr:DedA family protein [Candidatus Saccharimonas sp.]